MESFITSQDLLNNPAWDKWFRSIGIPLDKVGVTGFTLKVGVNLPVSIQMDMIGDERLLDNPPPKVKTGPDACTNLLRVVTGETGPPLGTPEHSAAVSRACREFLEQEKKPHNAQPIP